MQTVELVGRLLISLAVVIGLIYVVARRMRGGRRRALRTDRLIDILGRQNLTRASSVAVVRVADRALIVGVTDSSVRVLGELELDAVQATLVERDPSARRGSAPRDPMPRRPSVGDTADDVASDDREFADITAGFADPDESIPASPAELAGTLTAADIEAIRARRAPVGGYVIPDGPARAAGRTRKARADAAPQTGPLAGSALSPATWRQTLDALRDLTARKG